MIAPRAAYFAWRVTVHGCTVDDNTASSPLRLKRLMVTPPKSRAGHGAASSSSAQHQRSGQDSGVIQLRRAFRLFASALVVSSRHAEKTASSKRAEEARAGSVDELVKKKQAIRMAAAAVEGRLRGNAREDEALRSRLRSQPCVGGRRKRKFADCVP